MRLKNIRQPATVRRLLPDGGIEVEAGFLRMQVPETEVEEILPPSGETSRPKNIQYNQGPAFETSYREINLLGRRAEEAVDSVDKFLDTAALAQVDRVTHHSAGHGMGILKKAVAELLQPNPHVAKFYVAPPEEGGTGATIVELK